MLRSARSAPPFATRGVVLLPEDLTLRAWPDRAKQSGLNDRRDRSCRNVEYAPVLYVVHRANPLTVEPKAI